MINPHDDNFYGQPQNTQSYERRIRVLTAAVEDLTNQVTQWKANARDMADRNAFLRERHDLPVDRLPAMRRMEELQEAERFLTNAVDAAIKDMAYYHELAKKYEADSDRYKHLIYNNRRYKIQLPYIGLQAKADFDKAIDIEIAFDKDINP
jgi:hypothetical protein